MPDETTILENRQSTLLAEIMEGERHHLRLARLNYYSASGLLWAALLAATLAAIWGLFPSSWPEVEKWQLGLFSALSVAITSFSRQAGFQQKANWHYRKVDELRALRRRLQYELPAVPTAADIAAVSNSLSAMDIKMSKEWEDMKSEPARAKPPKTTN